LAKSESLKKQKEPVIIKNDNSQTNIILGSAVPNTQPGPLSFAQSFLNKIKGTELQ